ncbi:hypothetical protein D6779_00320, partial [Candidatus Parcubacteria bacterium]
EVNRISPLLIPVHAGRPNQQLRGIRSCHFSCWKSQLMKVNGFDQRYEGWGREDSDLAARLFHAGFKRRNLRGMPVLHLWHEERSRDALARNDGLLAEVLCNRRIRAKNGIAELEPSSE